MIAPIDQSSEPYIKENDSSNIGNHVSARLRHMYLLLSMVLGFSFEPASFSAAAIPPNNPDKLVLLSFKSFITEDPSQVLNQWNSSSQFCHWRGVDCRDGSKRVTSLRLNSLGLAGRITPFLSNLTFLKVLDLSDNNFHGLIPPELGDLSGLQYLNLSMNVLGGVIPTRLFMNCRHLRRVGLSQNSLVGKIPHNLSLCYRLREISLEENGLVGSIPPVLGFLPSVETLLLHDNYLTGHIPPEISNITALSILDLYGNNLRGRIPVELCRVPMLSELVLGKNKLSGTIPPICNFSHLSLLDLQSNRLHGILPSFTFLKLELLYLSVNKLTGPIPSSLSNITTLQEIELVANKFSGMIPTSLGSLNNLRVLSLGENELHMDDGWVFLQSLANCTSLSELSLNDNHIQGNLPSFALSNLSKKLTILDMKYNQISGNVPSGIGELINLQSLDLSNNFLTGEFPESVGSLLALRKLDLQENNLSGEIPSSMGNLSHLYSLNLSNNHLTGRIPLSFRNLKALQVVNLSGNKLNGSLWNPIRDAISVLYSLDLSGNSLTGPIPLRFFDSLSHLNLLDLSHNRLSGQIPRSVMNKVLQELYMENNSFEGTIPEKLASLKGLKVLNLSSNNLSGSIPPVVSRAMEYLDLSFNPFLEGRVPEGGIFSNLTSFSIRGNVKLCGGIPELQLPNCDDSMTKRPRKRNKKRLVIIIMPAIVVVVLTILTISFVCKSKFTRSKDNSVGTASFQLTKLLRVSYKDLLRATNNFSEENLVGAGSFGCVYRAILLDDKNNHKVVAVKVLNLHMQGASKTFLSECNALRSVRHRNLVTVITSCSSTDFKGNDFKAIVFDFMPNGSLNEWLHSDIQANPNAQRRNKLSILQRLNVAIDIACALDYLHHNGEKQIVHCDLKPSNVLLGDDMTAHVGDFGLARFLPKCASKQILDISNSNYVKGSIGYIAPEYAMGGDASILGDIYSYGILLLEMITARRPTDDIFNDGLSIHTFVARALPERLTSIIDPELNIPEENEEVAYNGGIRELCVHRKTLDCILSMLRVGLVCSNKIPKDRMVPANLIKEMHAIKQKFTA